MFIYVRTLKDSPPQGLPLERVPADKGTHSRITKEAAAGKVPNVSHSKRSIKKIEDAILDKRYELAALSNSLNKEVERQLTIKMHQESYLEIFKTANQKPALKEKLAEIVKVNSEIEQARGKLEEMRVVKDSGVNQRYGRFYLGDSLCWQMTNKKRKLLPD